MLLSKFLDPKNDFAFRRIFGSERNKDILIHFLNDMLTFREDAIIKEVSFLKTVQDPEIASKKTSIVDVLCVDEEGKKYIVEMQVARTKGFEKRAQYYAAKAYVNQLNRSEEYENLKEIIFLAITDFVMFPDKSSYKSDHMILDRDSYERDLKDFSFTFVELPKFTLGIDQLETMTEKWCYFFKHADETKEKEIDQITGSDIIIKRAYEELDQFSWNEEELNTYEQALKQQRDARAIEAAKQEDFEKGLEKAFKEGIEKGIEKGKLEGIQEGKEKAFYEVAVNLLKLSLPLEKVSEATGLSVSVLKELKKLTRTIP